MSDIQKKLAQRTANMFTYKENTQEISALNKRKIETKKTEIIKLLDALIREYEIMTHTRLEAIQNNRVEVFVKKLSDLRI